MGKIVVTEFVSVDGVSDDPAGVEGFERGGWSFRPNSDGERVRLRGEEGEELLLAENRNAAALLLGRKTYEFLAGFFPQQEGRALADVINSMPKYVVSSTPVNAEWNNSRVLSGEPADEAGRLKREIDGEILVPGSTQLVQALIEHGLVDELRLMVHPVVVGGGRKLFGGTTEVRPLRLVHVKQVGEGVVILTYEPIPDPDPAQDAAATVRAEAE
jgi:dihydrofolate reductase